MDLTSGIALPTSNFPTQLDPSSPLLRFIPSPTSAATPNVPTLSAPLNLTGLQNPFLAYGANRGDTALPALRQTGPTLAAPTIPPPSQPNTPSIGQVLANNSQLLSQSHDLISSQAQARQQAAEQRVDYLMHTGSGVDQIAHPLDANGNPTTQHPGFWRTLGSIGAHIGDAALSIAAPGIAAVTPGTTLHHQMLLNQAEGQEGQATNQLQGQATLLDSQAQARQRAAMADQDEVKAYAMTHPKPDDGQLLYDKNGSPIGFRDGTGNYYGPNDPNLPAGVGDILSSAQRKQPTNPFELWQQQNPKGTAEDYLTLTSQGKVKSLAEQYNDALANGDTPTANRILKVIHDTATQPKIDVHDGEATSPTGTWTPGFDANKNPVMFNNKTGEVKPMDSAFNKNTAANAKISSDEQKRADLAQNMNENIDALEDIATRRPELFGPIAGRETDLKTAFGSTDPDIAKLQVIKHQLGMVAQGAHGMRSAQGVEAAANSLTNGYHNSPEALRAGLESARQSVQTFLGDAQNAGQPRYAHTATGANGQQIGSNDGKKWFDVKTGGKI